MLTIKFEFNFTKSNRHFCSKTGEGSIIISFAGANFLSFPFDRSLRAYSIPRLLSGSSKRMLIKYCAVKKSLKEST